MLSEQKVSRLFLIPSLLKNMISFMKLEGMTLPYLNHWESTGEPLTMEVARTFFDFFPKNNVLCNIYGGTEMMDNIYDKFESWDEVVSNQKLTVVMLHMERLRSPTPFRK